MKKNYVLHFYAFIFVLDNFSFVRAQLGKDRFSNYKYYQDDSRFRKHTYSNTEFEHAVDDERCSGRPEIIEITRETRHGNIRGREVSLCDTPGLQLRFRPGNPNAYVRRNSVRVFLGIPYAEPPVHENRFKPPKRKDKFPDINDPHYKPACPQNAKYLMKGKGINTTDEDCLYLNIFTPGQGRCFETIQGKFAVMFYIHDGNFDHGSGSLFPGHMLAASQCVVVVTFNYRLGHLGFLATGDGNSPGNYGILDQIEALRWVYENIGVFDGDNSRITLVGSGAGGASAALLALSPLSRRMVKRVISQNASPIADWAVITDRLFMFNTSQILGEEVGCSNHDLSLLVHCIGTRTNNEIQIIKIKPRKGWLPWGPVIDNYTRRGEEQLLPWAPKEMLERRVVFNDEFAYMTGISRDEGVSIFLEDYQNPSDLEINEEKFIQKIKDFMRMYNYTVNSQGIFDAIEFMYKPSVDVVNKNLREAYIHMLTDRYYVAPLAETLQLMIKNRVTTYAYVLNYTFQGYSTILKDFVSSEIDYLLLSGAPFMDPKFYPSVLNLANAKWTQEDRNMSQFMMEAWANFAKEGNPTKTRLFNTILWEPVTENNYICLNLNATNTTSTMIADYRERESRFWNSFLPFFIDREPPTLAPTLEPGVAELRIVTSALWGSVALATILIIITLICCTLYCRIRSQW
ncbi:neuroligin-4, Y-linked-like isoform X2 [Stegodyphus dumicola]|uniref:neuroligin-4, Y-linked-like isoform X2 n=1 Tax=Stegodyphus dumicola TaxID=202533 RepID=UPI0015B292FC|nr:neuroligin-4, Y-linked-like isoform X2 [Stegodyphus dumicola]XP_035228463.1 neuroligin-4, Y-linked-like isoform X2 [Stegodyphus dumicola]